jgi:hypothetical protein
MKLHAEEFLDELDALVEDWCEGRALFALALILPSYLSYDGSDAALERLHASLDEVASEHSQRLTAEGYRQVRHLVEVTGGMLPH